MDKKMTLGGFEAVLDSFIPNQMVVLEIQILMKMLMLMLMNLNH